MRLQNRWANRILSLLLLGYAGVVGVRIAVPRGAEQRAAAPEPGAIHVYFTNPDGPGAFTFRGGPDERLAAAIDNASDTVDIAAYDLDLWSVRDALIRAHQRGLRVRLVMESSNLDRPEVADLMAAGIEVRADRRPHLMHDKFIVLDGNEVWTGSMNFTVNGAYRNNNNLLQLRSDRIGALYAAEFAEMFERDEFGQLSAGQAPNPQLQLDGIPIEVWFAPDQPVGQRVTELIDGAQHSIDLMAFNLTADPVTGALLAAQDRGVKVRGVFERAQANTMGSDLDRLALAGVEVVLDANARNMHHKVIVIDGEIVITGSYNFSRSANEDNDENLLVLFSPELAERYLIEFSRLRTQGLQ